MLDTCIGPLLNRPQRGRVVGIPIHPLELPPAVKYSKVKSPSIITFAGHAALKTEAAKWEHPPEGAPLSQQHPPNAEVITLHFSHYILAINEFG